MFCLDLCWRFYDVRIPIFVVICCRVLAVTINRKTFFWRVLADTIKRRVPPARSGGNGVGNVLVELLLVHNVDQVTDFLPFDLVGEGLGEDISGHLR